MYGVLPNPILLPGQRTRLIQPGAAPQLRPRSNAGSLLFVRQGAAVPPGGGAEAGPAEQLRQCAWVPGAGVTAPALFAAPHIPYPIAAPATPERGIKTASRGRAKRAAAALVPGFSRSFHRRHYAISDLSQNRANARAFQEEPVGNCARPLSVIADNPSPIFGILPGQTLRQPQGGAVLLVALPDRPRMKGLGVVAGWLRACGRLLVTYSLFFGNSLARGVRQKLSKAPGKKQAFRQAFWACNKRTNRRISKSTVADNQQLTYKRTGEFQPGINDWPLQNHS